MELLLLLLLLSTSSNYAQFTLPSVCYDQSVINGTACCASLNSQCESDSETYFNCTYGPQDIQTNLIYLSMKKCGLAGTIPSDITKLPYLRRFDLSYNYLEGTIPEAIGEIGNGGTGIQYIDLSNNQFTGTIPKTFGDEPTKYTLKHLDMSHNYFTRANLPSIVELTIIEHLDLSENNIADTFHESLGEFQALRVLNFGTNRFSGSIPDSIGGLTELRVLNIERNDMSGTLPKELSLMNNLQILNISDNKFEGTIPEEWGNDWGDGKLEQLNLGENENFGCPVRDYSGWSKQSDFVVSYGENGELNCNSGNNDSDDSNGLDGVEVAIIVIAVIVLLAIGLYCLHGRKQKAVREQVSMLHDADAFDD